MKIRTFVFLLHFWFPGVICQKGLQCFVPGECLDSQILGATPTDNSRECWRHCQNVTGCTWFTFYKDSKICTPLSGCLRLSNEKCSDNCISGEEECPEVQCGVHGRCYGALEGIRKVGSAEECGTICESHQECFWNTYDPHHESCLMTNDCPLLDRSCANCSSSERNCVAESGLSKMAAVTTKQQFLLGTDFKQKTQLLNMETKTTNQCILPHIPAMEPIMQFTTFGSELHVCADGEVDGNIAMACSKLDNEKKIWTPNGHLQLRGGQFISFLNLPNGGILLLIKAKSIYLYDGEKVRLVSEQFPYSNDNDFSKPFCRTAISNDEILVGFAPEKIAKNGNLSEPVVMYAINLSNMTTDVLNITIPNINLMNSLCGAFGAEGNRKVAIFGGHQIIMGKPGPAFEKTLILDWNSKTFDTSGPIMTGIYSGQGSVQTIGYEDTFLVYTISGSGSKVYKFDINGQESKLLYIANLPMACMNFAPFPSNVPGCT